MITSKGQDQIRNFSRCITSFKLAPRLFNGQFNFEDGVHEEDGCELFVEDRPVVVDFKIKNVSEFNPKNDALSYISTVSVND